MNRPFPFSNNLTVGLNYAVPGGITDARFRDVQYSQDGCGGAQCSQSTSDLKYQVFFPKGYTQFLTCPLPCVIVAHPGEFSDCSNYNLTSGWCCDLAQLGFVAINLEYRRGTRSEGSGNSNITVQSALALYRASKMYAAPYAVLFTDKRVKELPEAG